MENKFLKDKYDLHRSPEIAAAAKRAEIRAALRGENVKIPETDADRRIQNYLDRFSEIINEPNLEKKDRQMRMLKHFVLGANVTKFEDIPDSYWKSQERILRERGQQGDYDRFSDEEKDKWKKELSEGQLEDQKASLEQWIDYFVSDASTHIPDYLMYWIFRSVLGLAEYDKEKQKFPERSRGTLKMFPDINSRALDFLVARMQEQCAGQSISWGDHQHDFSNADKQAFQSLLRSENFAKLYAWSNEKIAPIPKHLLEQTDGVWVKYDQNANHLTLVESLRGWGTGWCTAGESTAAKQLWDGDFYCYYTYDDAGQPTIPRAAIRMEDDKIAEVRGIAAKQNLDPYIAPVVQAKLTDFPDGTQYEKKAADMQQPTLIERKIQSEQELTRDELIFLYEIDHLIEGFGYRSDPRIAELRQTRNAEADMPIVFDCTPAEIARAPDDITEHTKAYVGQLTTSGIFRQLYHVERIYNAFPERKIPREKLELPGLTGEEWIKELEKVGIKIHDYIHDDALQTLKSPEFTNRVMKRGVIDTLPGRKDASSPGNETANLIRLTIADLGFPNDATTNDIYAKAEELGLELCSAEVGPALRKKYTNQPLSEQLFVGMKQITNSNGEPYIFRLHHYDDGLWLRNGLARPDREWDPTKTFVFCLPSSGASRAWDD